MFLTKISLLRQSIQSLPSISSQTDLRFNTNQSFFSTNALDWYDRFENAGAKRFNKILIANRGEIACRVIESAKSQGINTVAVYSDADKNAQHVKLADEAFHIGPAAASASYLVGEKLLQVAKRTGALGIHPGYGFLSENASFADQCEKQGIVFIGPPSSAIRSMGSKSASKEIMSEANVPVVPGYHGEDQSIDKLIQEAEKIGYPLLIKAVLGGGGKGMRIVNKRSELESAIESAKREALSSFSDDRVLLERYIQRPRHVEIQVFADAHGNAVYLFERDCSLQRRYQKVIEEAPAPELSDATRKKMGETAVAAAHAVGYVGAGTVEFIVDANDQSFYFMEMNTRLQVEHPVTEMITRQDLVSWQLHVAAGGQLPLAQKDLAVHGHSFEARIYAENPRANFMPGSGKLTYMDVPENSKHVRIDTGVRAGDEVSVHYDPMIAKLIVWDQDRPLALQRLRHALDRFNVAGLSTNIDFLKNCCDHDAFKAAELETHFIENYKNELLPQALPANTTSIGAAALALIVFNHHDSAINTVGSAPAVTTNRFRPNIVSTDQYTLIEKDTGNEIQVRVAFDQSSSTGLGSSYTLESVVRDGEADEKAAGLMMQVHSYAPNSGKIKMQVGDELIKGKVVVDTDNDEVYIFEDNGTTHHFDLPTLNFDPAAAATGSVFAPMPGKITKILVKPGETVTKDTPLLVMEAMKMEHVIHSPIDGVIQSISCTEQAIIDEKTALVIFEDDDGDE